MPPELNPNAIYEFEYKETSHALSFFMPYDLEISLPNDVVIELGRFSLGMLARVHVIPPYSGGASLKIGAFCEAAAKSTIMLGGNHPNRSLLNYSFGIYNEYYRQFMGEDDRSMGLEPVKPIIIGDNVILSRESMILGGAQVGTGCVIGAGSVVAGHCEPLGIYVGSPAKNLRPRFEGRMADLYNQLDLPNISAHSVISLPTMAARLEAGVIDIAEFRSSVSYLTARPKVHVSALLREGAVAISGVERFSVGDDPINDEATVTKLRNYFSQPTTKPDRIKWSPDIFVALGLVGPRGG